MTYSKRPIVLVLGGGGARVAASAKALEVLFNEGIRPDYIVGTSMGFVVGGLIAAGWQPQEICRYFKSGKLMSALLPASPLSRLFSMSISMVKHLFGRGDYDGLYNGRTLRSVLNACVGQRRIENFNTIPVAGVVFNLITGRSELIDKGEFGLVAAATTAVPALFCPVEIGNALYADGGVFDNLPVRLAKDIANKMNDAIVIAINVNEPFDEEVPVERFRKIGTATFRIMSAHSQLTDEPQESLADVVIRAKVPVRLTSKNRNDIDVALEAGERAAKEALPQIRACLAADSRPAKAPKNYRHNRPASLDAARRRPQAQLATA